MHKLAEMQKRFQQFILDNDETIHNDICATPASSVEKRFEIYQAAYYSRLEEVLKKDYPVLLAVLGEKAFATLAYRYIEAYPSTHRSIRWYGDKFSQFIRQHKARNNAWQAELAAFEWLLTIAFDAASAMPVSPEEVAKIPSENWPFLRFQMHPSIQLIHLRWNVPFIWMNFKEKGQIIKPLKLEKALTWVIWRKGLEVHFQSLTPEERYALKTIQAGKNFATVCNGLCRFLSPEKVPSYAALLLKQFISNQMLIADF